MMRRIWTFLTDSRNLTIIGLTAMAALFYLGAQVLELALIWALAATAAMLALAGAVWGWRRWRARRESERLGEAIVDPSVAEVKAIRDSMLKAIDTIKGSKLGMVSGARALYELPWYMVIGNPAAGKSTAITNSGLQFPFADGKVLQGVGGTRNCDWFFTTEGILLDTAGRYSVLDEHRTEWFGFLDLLKKYRRRAPVNGIVIAVSMAELRGEDPEAGIQLARSLRKRVQDLIERLEIFAPVYVVFTKADLIAGFGEFFAQAERAERERVWGATMKTAIERHEPRLRNVQARLEHEPGSINRVRFAIYGTLAGLPRTEAVSFDAVLQPSSLHYSINRSARGGRK